MLDNRPRIFHWVEAGLLDENNLAQAIELTNSQPDRQQWLKFIQLGLLWLAVGAFGCGVIFFFAYNWQDIPRLAKFALVELAVCLCAVVYLIHSVNKIISTALLMAMTVLTGALLALVGQTFQTGADPWQLFALWAAFMLPWSLIGRSSILWIFNILLSNLALFLYLDIHRGALWMFWSSDNVFWLFFTFNSSLLVLFELEHVYHFFARLRSSDNHPSSSTRYPQQLLATVALCSISLVAFESLWEGALRKEILAYLLILAAVLAIYRYLLKDLFMLALACLSFIFISSCFILSHLNSAETGIFLLTGLNIIACSALAGRWLKNLAAEFKRLPIAESPADRQQAESEDDQ
ncbi:MAG: hypothetical protein OFPI_32160 [Osedax symbiont Rs2]|nr:MAG: hypothetical protein OFPI_32160 [Osedax symbiont Rs2]